MTLTIKKEVGIPGTLLEATELQLRLGRGVHLGVLFKHVAGVSLVYAKDETLAHVAVAVLSTTNWALVHAQTAVLPVTRNRESDMDNFREGPLMLEVLGRLAINPDVILVDGHGIAHPRRFGVATHVGFSLDHPTVGIGEHWPEGCGGPSVTFPGVGGRAKRGTRVALLHSPSGDIVGHRVHTQELELPIFVSPGYRVSADEGSMLALRSAPWHRLPEPLHVAREMARKHRDAQTGS